MSLIAIPMLTPGPAPSPVPLLIRDAVPCYRQPTESLCTAVYRWTHNDWLAQSSDWVIAKPFRVLAIFVLATLLKKIVHRTIKRLSERMAGGAVLGGLMARVRNAAPESALANERRAQRAATMSSVLQSFSTGVIYSIALLMSLSELTFNIGPLIAGAGIIGVALGFGSQSLVKDFLSGLFMILEDQYGVGDQVDLGSAKGVVESVGLRVTRVRDSAGTYWYVRNGEIARVGNQTQGWSLVIIDLDLPPTASIDEVRAVLTEAGHKLMAGSFASSILEHPEIWGVQALSQNAIVMRVVVKTQSTVATKVELAFRELIAATLVEHEVDLGAHMNTLWLRSDGTGVERAISLPGPDATGAPATHGLPGN